MPLITKVNFNSENREYKLLLDCGHTIIRFKTKRGSFAIGQNMYCRKCDKTIYKPIVFVRG